MCDVIALDQPAEIHVDQEPERIRRRAHRKMLFAQDPTCFYCRRRMQFRRSTLDHVQPLSRGGEDSVENLVLCCQRCNWGKGDQTLLEWFSQLAAACCQRGLIPSESVPPFCLR